MVTWFLLFGWEWNIWVIVAVYAYRRVLEAIWIRKMKNSSDLDCWIKHGPYTCTCTLTNSNSDISFLCNQAALSHGHHRLLFIFIHRSSCPKCYCLRLCSQLICSTPNNSNEPLQSSTCVIVSACILFDILFQTNIEITAETDFNRLLQIEEEQVQKMCEDIIALKPDLVFTEKGVSGICTCTYEYSSIVDGIYTFLLY